MTCLEKASRTASVDFLIALALIVAFVAMQALTLNYGTHINDLPFIRDYHITTNVADHSGLKRGQLVGGKATPRAESLDLWMTRFKLYSVEADEPVNIIALARIKPAALQFNPGFYEYGGAYLYPLGAWYFALSKLGVIHVAPLSEMLKQPQDMDRVWIAGRAFVLIAFALSAILFFLALTELAPGTVALSGLIIYLLCPGSIVFSQMMKPHWYALLWVNVAILVLVRAFGRKRLTLTAELGLAACIGLAVGSALTFSIFAVLVWGALIWLVANGAIDIKPLIRVPLVAILVFIATNPYYVLDWHAVEAERIAAASWFHPAANFGVFATFFRTSLLSGFGAIFVVVTSAVAVWRLIAGPAPARLSAIAILIPPLLTAVLTAKLITWTVNFRYMSYELPLLLVFLAAWPWPFRVPAMLVCALLTAVQAAPMKLAYFDENSANHSTRLTAAAWIDRNIPKTDSICVPNPSLAPYSVPPFRFDLYPVDRPDCRWKVLIERNPLTAPTPAGFTIAKRFKPRLSPQAFPLVWGHINPQITIYRKDG